MSAAVLVAPTKRLKVKRKRKRPPSGWERFAFIAMVYNLIALGFNVFLVLADGPDTITMIGLGLHGSQYVGWRWVWKRERRKNGRD